MEKVSVVKCDKYDVDRIVEIVEHQFVELEADKPIIKSGDKVVIKPNLVMSRSPEEATTTHPTLIAAIIRAVKKRGGMAIIAESPGGAYTKGALKSIYAKTGMTEVCEREGAELNFDVGTSEIDSDDGKRVKRFEFINPIITADVVISAAKLKTHGQMTYSGAVKNLFGCVPGLKKPEFHYRFPQKEDFAAMIVDICETVKPSISFIDAVVGMEGNGPTGGKPKELDCIIASTNPHAADLVGCALIGFPPEKIPTVNDAIEREICPKSIKDLIILDDGLPEAPIKIKAPDSVSLDFVANMPGFIKKPINKLFTPHPKIVKSGCVGCGKCAESCPQHTIKIKDGKALIDYSNCIKCFCCHEMCPQKTIKIRRFNIFGKL